MKLLFFSFRLMRATTQPSRHESTITITDTSSTISTPPTIAPAVTGAVSQYTITPGTMTTAAYIKPQQVHAQQARGHHAAHRDRHATAAGRCPWTDTGSNTC